LVSLEKFGLEMFGLEKTSDVWSGDVWSGDVQMRGTELPSPSQSRLLLPPDGDAGGEGGG
jgi:hypothetical protein